MKKIKPSELKLNKVFLTAEMFCIRKHSNDPVAKTLDYFGYLYNLQKLSAEEYQELLSCLLGLR